MVHESQNCSCRKILLFSHVYNALPSLLPKMVTPTHTWAWALFRNQKGVVLIIKEGVALLASFSSLSSGLSIGLIKE